MTTQTTMTSPSQEQAEDSYLGQFIPVHYHHNMLQDSARMAAFRSAIDHVVFPGARVLELGGGTGVLSCFAARKASKVYCVEFNPDMVTEARRLLALNPGHERVEVIHADAFDYLPPEPVDVVICEMIHVGMLREKQVDVIESFKQRYAARFVEPLPVFVPEVVIMAVQPLEQTYDFHGFHAPIVQFQQPGVLHPDVRELADPAVYSFMDFRLPVANAIAWEGVVSARQSGWLNSLRYITKNVLAVVEEASSTIDWLNHYMTLPLRAPVKVRQGDLLRISFAYTAGGAIRSLESSIEVSVVVPPAIRTDTA